MIKSLLSIALMFLLGGCRQPDAPPPVTLPHDDTPVVTVASTTQIAHLNAVLPDSLSVTRTYAVRSETHEWGHYLAAKLRGATSETIGIWFMYDGMDIPGDAFAVNAIARRVSTLPPFPDVAPEQLGEHPEITALEALTRERE